MLPLNACDSPSGKRFGGSTPTWHHLNTWQHERERVQHQNEGVEAAEAAHAMHQVLFCIQHALQLLHPLHARLYHALLQACQVHPLLLHGGGHAQQGLVQPGRHIRAAAHVCHQGQALAHQQATTLKLGLIGAHQTDEEVLQGQQRKSTELRP